VLTSPTHWAKRWAKLPVTATLFIVGHYGRHRRRLPPDQALILIYHHVSGRSNDWWAPFQRGVPRERFDRQMRFLRHAMTPMSLRDIVAAIRGGSPIPRRAVVVTFDDGYLDNFTVAYPILRRYDIPATIFVTTSLIGTNQTFWWEEVYWLLKNTSRPFLDGDGLARVVGHTAPVGRYQLTTTVTRTGAAEAVIDILRSIPSVRRSAGLAWLRSSLSVRSEPATAASSMMMWEHLREMRDHGMAIESHTHSHPILGLHDPEFVEEELATSKRLIEKHLGDSPEGVAYPDGRPGSYNDATAAAAQAVGFRFGCVATPSRVGSGADLFSLGRMTAPNAPLPVFVRDLLRAYATR